jgi:hypothetical protein
MSNIPHTKTQSIITIEVPISLYIQKKINIQFQLFYQHTNIPPQQFIPNSQHIVEPIELINNIDVVNKVVNNIDVVNNIESTVNTGLPVLAKLSVLPTNSNKDNPVKRKQTQKKPKNPKKPKSDKPRYIPKIENGRYKYKTCRQCLVKKSVEEFNRSKVYVYEALCKICQESYIKLGNQYFYKTIKFEKCRRTKKSI